jgi:NADH-quinone oxidoreductase subunit C
VSPEEFAARVGGVASLSAGNAFARPTVDVPPAAWAEAAQAARDDGLDFFDWLSAVDELDDGFRIVVHLWSTVGRNGLLIRTLTSRATPVVASLVAIYPGAAWHERETHEMFGVDFAGHPGLTPLLLPPEFEGHPLRKEFILASRVAKPWPGAKEPGEGGHE